MPWPIYCVIRRCQQCGHESREYGASDCIATGLPCNQCRSTDLDIIIESQPESTLGKLIATLQGRTVRW
jgi:hypothetical protein